MGDFFQKASYREEQKVAALNNKNIKQIKEVADAKVTTKDTVNNNNNNNNNSNNTTKDNKQPATPEVATKNQNIVENKQSVVENIKNNINNKNNNNKQISDVQKLKEDFTGHNKKRDDETKTATTTDDNESNNNKIKSRFGSKAKRFQPDGTINSNFQSKTAASIAALSSRSTGPSTPSSVAPSTTDYQTDESATATDSTTATDKLTEKSVVNDVKKLDVKKDDSSNSSSSSPEHSVGTPKVQLRNNSVKRASFKRRSKCDVADTKNLASDFDKIFNRLSMGNSTSSVSDADIKSILDQVEQHQKELSTLTPIGAEKNPDGDGVNKNDGKLSGVSSQKTSVR